MLAVFTYAIGIIYQYNATLGKMAMNIIVLRSSGSKLSLGRIALREIIGKMVSGILLCIGYIMVAFSSKKQGLHDKIADSVVVYKVPGKSNKTGVVIALTCILLPFLLVCLFLFSYKDDSGTSGLDMLKFYGYIFSGSMNPSIVDTSKVSDANQNTETGQSETNSDNEERDRMLYYLDSKTLGVLTPESYWSVHEPELRKQLKKLYPDANTSVGSLDLKPKDEFDFTGDNIPEVFVRLLGGGSTSDRYGLFTQIDGKLQIMKMADKYEKITDAYLWSGAGGSGRYGSGFSVYSFGEMLGVSSYSQYGEANDTCSEVIYNYNPNVGIFQYNALGTEVATKKFCGKMKNPAARLSGYQGFSLFCDYTSFLVHLIQGAAAKQSGY